MLYGKRFFEKIDGSDGGNNPGSVPDEGYVAELSAPIHKHGDVFF
jgi:hypothetical protein